MKVKHCLGIGMLFISCSLNFEKSEMDIDSSSDIVESIDTLFQFPFYTTFSVNNNKISVIGENNSLLSYTDTGFKLMGEIDSEYYVERLFHTSENLILAGIGTEYLLEEVFILDSSINIIKSIKSLNVLSINKFSNHALCLGDYSSDKFLSLAEQIINYHFLYDFNNNDTLKRFKDNFLVVNSGPYYHEFNFNEFLVGRDNKLEVIKYSKNGKELKKFSINLKKDGSVPVYFFENNKYLSYTSGKYTLSTNDGKVLKTFNVAPQFFHQFSIQDESLNVFGWLDTDNDKLDSYFFVKQTFSVNY